MPSALLVRKFGPFVRGVIDRANPSLDLTGTLKKARGLRYSGAGKLRVRGGTQLAMTLKDDVGAGANVTSVCALVPFNDGALAVAHSTVTNEVYLYRLNSTLDGWYSTSGLLQNNRNAQPVGVLWIGIPTPPDVLIAEGLGIAYIAHTQAADGTTLSYPTKQFTQPATIATVTADLDGSGGAEDLYFLGLASFKNHLWGWGVGSGTTAANHYRPELARFSAPSFGAFSSADSITLGDRVRSQREKIIAGVACGDALFLAAPFLLSRVTGFGRTSWQRAQLSKDGIVGPKAGCAVVDTFYGWGQRGPYRCPDLGRVELLWDKIPAAIESAVNVAKIVAVHDEGNDLVTFFYDAGAGVRAMCSFDIVRELWVGPDDDIGLAIRHAATIAPVYASTSAPTIGPAAPPTTPTTTNVGSTSAQANWIAGDGYATARVDYKRRNETEWTNAITGLPAGVSSYVINGLTPGAEYDWRVAHDKDGITSAYLGPLVATQFTTSGTALLAPTNLALSQVAGDAQNTIVATWVNAGDPNADTAVELAGPSLFEPATTAFDVRETVAAPGAGSYGAMIVTQSGKYWVRVRHVRSGFVASDYTTAVSIDISVDGGLL